MTIYEVFNRWAERKALSGAAAPDYGAAEMKRAHDRHVEVWKAYYRGEVDGIHSDRGWNGEREYAVARKSMMLPRLIARRWATTLLSEAFKVTLATERETEKFGALSRKTGLRPKLVEAVEAGFALGTAAVVAGADAGRRAIWLDVVKYDNIYPLIFTQDEMEAVAFARRRRAKGGERWTVSVHSRLEGGGSRIENFEALAPEAAGGDAEFSAIEGVAAEAEYANQMYCVARPNAGAGYTEELPFGRSIYADALAACDDVDLASAGLRRDVKEGDQVTFIGRDMLLMKSEGGERRRYFDNGAGRFFTIDQDVGAGARRSGYSRNTRPRYGASSFCGRGRRRWTGRRWLPGWERARWTRRRIRRRPA